MIAGIGADFVYLKNTMLPVLSSAEAGRASRTQDRDDHNLKTRFRRSHCSSVSVMSHSLGCYCGRVLRTLPSACLALAGPRHQHVQ